MKRRKGKMLLIALVAILILGIGYAAISSVGLSISGSSSIQANGDFKVRFVRPDSNETAIDNAQENAIIISGKNADSSVMDVSEMSASITDDTHATFAVGTLDEIGEYVDFTYTVVNESDGIDAALSLDVSNESELSNYFEISKNIAKNKITENETTTITVRVKLISQPKLRDIEENFSVTLTATPVEEVTGTGGNIEDGPHSLTVSDLTSSSNLVSEGDGLYEDPYENGRYIYRGLSPNNYLTFNGEEAGWRIVAIESDQTVKIIRDSDVTNMVFDESNARSSSTYCYYSRDYGCNAWAATSDLIGNPAQFILYNPDGNQSTATDTFAGTVAKNSILNIWLNNEYYNNPENNVDYLNSDKSYIVAHNFFVGTPGNFADEESISDDIVQEKNYIWNGNVGLITATDFMKASIGDTCTNIKSFRSSSKCGLTNYLTPQSGEYWTISPYVSKNRGLVWLPSSSGYLSYLRSNVSKGVRPSVFLTSNIKLSGEGRKDKPYEIVK